METASPGDLRWYSLHRHLWRAFHYNLSAIRLAPEERARLESSGVHDETLQRYLAWRHSVLLASCGPALLGALLFLSDLAQGDFEDASTLGRYWLAIDVLGVVALPVATVAGAVAWRRQHLSARIVMYGFLISLILPLLFIVLPADWFFSLTDVDIEDRAAARREIRVYWAVQDALQLSVFLPTLLMSVIFGVQRACLRLKTLLPESTVSGWFLAATAPLFPLTLLPIFAVLNQVGGDLELFLGMVLLVSSSLVYAACSRVFVRPLPPAGLVRVAWVQRISKGCFWLGALCLLFYATRVRVPIPDFGEDGLPTGWHWKTLLGWNHDTALYRPWDEEVVRRLFIDVLSRSLFTTVLMTDLLLRVTLSIWHNVHAVSAAVGGADHDRVMEALYQVTTE